MTTIRQLIQTSPSKAGELFAKLVDTSEGAIKTRERLFSELKAELDLQAKLEEQHLFPVLKKHEGTKGLVAEALDDNRQTRRLLAELERTPKDSEAFGAKVAELRKVFQQHVRDNKKEFLPAVVKALSDEEASTVAGKMGDGKAEIEAAHRADAEKRPAKREREEAEAARQAQAEREEAEAARKAAAKREREEAEAARQAKVEREREEAEANRRAADAAKATKAAAETARSTQDEAGAVIERIEDKAEPARRADAGERRPEAEHAVAEAAGRTTEAVRAGAVVAPQGAKVARMAMRAGTDAVGKGDRVAQASAPSEEAHEAARETDASPAAIGGSVTALLIEQTHHAVRTTTAIGHARTPSEVIAAQSDFISGSVQRMGRMNERTLAFVRAGMAASMSLPSSRR